MAADQKAEMASRETARRDAESEPSASRRPLRILAWAVACAFVAALFYRVPYDAVARALGEGPGKQLAVLVFFLLLVVLVADGVATSASLRAVGVEAPAARLVVVRGASYLLGLINYALGQGGVGVYLERSGVPASKAAGAVLFMIAVNIFVLVLCGILGAVASGYTAESAWLALPAAAGAVGYAMLIRGRPPALAQRALFKPFFDAGVRGHIVAALWRVPHIALLVAGQWWAFRVWGVEVPFARGVVLIALTLALSLLPITPNGLGMVQAFQVLVFSPYVVAATSAEREAKVLAFSLAVAAFSIPSQLIVGLACLPFVGRFLRAGAPTEAPPIDDSAR